MKLTDAEVAFLSAWARDEWEPRCYQRPAHQLQLANRVAGVLFISFIKAWTNNEGKKDRDILDAAQNPAPAWPWSTHKEFQARLEEARCLPRSFRIVTGRAKTKPRRGLEDRHSGRISI
jgi:hypothetical protein